MKALKDSSQMVHTVIIELTDKDVSQLHIDRRALPAGFPKIQELLGLVQEAIQPKPTTRSLSAVAQTMSDPNFQGRG